MNRIHGSGNRQWYALNVRSRHEKKVDRALRNSGLESSLPLMAVTRQWSDRRKVITLPMFPGYVFVEADLNRDKTTILATPGIVRFVSFNGVPAVIPSHQMYWLFQIMEECRLVQPETEFHSGTWVNVVAGPLRGLQGVVRRVSSSSSSRLVIWLDAIMQGISVEIDTTCLVPAGK